MKLKTGRQAGRYGVFAWENSRRDYPGAAQFRLGEKGGGGSEDSVNPGRRKRVLLQLNNNR